MSAISLVISSATGRQNTPPQTILANLITLVQASAPGYTANLPGSLIEDISSTDVGAISLCDAFVTELINSISPLLANPFILLQLGQVYGIQVGQDTNTSVLVVFSGTQGYPVAQGFVISDGTNQYITQDGAIIATGGSTSPVFCLAANPGSFAIPANTVNQLITSVPTGITLSVNNPQPGTAGEGADTVASYRARVVEAGLAKAQGMGRFLRTLLGNVSGVQSRLIAIRQANGGYEIIVGGGDPYEVANAIWTALFDINTLKGSVMTVGAITVANPGVITTALNHGLANGQTAMITGATGMTAINGVPGIVTVIDEKNFSLGIDTTSFGAYTGNGVVSPNSRNIIVNIQDYPDTYAIPYVLPPQQTVSIVVTWNTTDPNFVSDAGVAQAAAPALAAYVNGIDVGQPLNLFSLESVFRTAVSTLIPVELLTRMIFAVDINGVSTAPDMGTGVIPSDPESYFSTDPLGANMTITQG